MDALLTSAASGLRSRLEALDLLANNLANTNTPGYKSDREFYGIYMAASAGEPTSSTALPNIDGRWTDFAQGTLTPTGNPLDLAIEGPGFFAADSPSGVVYTRAGAFHLAPDGTLATNEGYPVRDASGGRIRLDLARPVEIEKDGTIRQQGVEAGRLALAEFSNPAVLVKSGHNYFRAPDQAGLKPAATAEVHQSRLEGSNVAAPEAAVRLVGILRQFEMLQKAIALGSDMGRRAIEDVARVNP